MPQLYEHMPSSCCWLAFLHTPAMHGCIISVNHSIHRTHKCTPDTLLDALDFWPPRYLDSYDLTQYPKTYSTHCTAGQCISHVCVSGTDSKGVFFSVCVFVCCACVCVHVCVCVCQHFSTYSRPSTNWDWISTIFSLITIYMLVCGFEKGAYTQNLHMCFYCPIKLAYHLGFHLVLEC